MSGVRCVRGFCPGQPGKLTLNSPIHTSRSLPCHAVSYAMHRAAMHSVSCILFAMGLAMGQGIHPHRDEPCAKHAAKHTRSGSNAQQSNSG